MVQSHHEGGSQGLAPPMILEIVGLQRLRLEAYPKQGISGHTSNSDGDSAFSVCFSDK
jgi:hypothetical protein